MLDWFTTIPGILIICGVLLLIIAIILFVAGAMKNKKMESSGDASLNTSVSDVQNSNVSNLNVDNSVTTNTISVSGMPSDVTQDTQLDSAVNTVENNEITVSPIIEESNNVISNNEEISNNVVSDDPVSDLEKTNVISIPDTEDIKEETIYGGATPTYNFTEVEKPVTIYGGNDPLEATQTLPKMEEVHIPYGGSNHDNKEINFNQVNMSSTLNESNVVEIPEFDEVKPIEINETVEKTITPVINIPSIDDSQNINNTLQTEVPSVTNISDNEDSVSVVEEL